MIEPTDDEVTRFEWLVQAAQDALPEDIPVSVLHVRLYPYVGRAVEGSGVADVVALDFANGEVTEVETTGPVGIATLEHVYADLPNNAPKAWWYALDNAGWMRAKEMRGRFILPLEKRESLRAFPVEGPIENPSPAMPPYEDVLALLVRCGVDSAPDVVDKVVAFLSYIQQALHALPAEVQGDLSCEYNFVPLSSSGYGLGNAGVCLAWSDDESMEADHGEDGEVDTFHDPNSVRQRITFGKIYVSVRRPRHTAFVGSPDEPAYLTHRDVMEHGGRDAVDEMQASGKWTYPMNAQGRPPMRKAPGHIISDGPRAGEKTKPKFAGTWQFVPAFMGGADHPSWKSEEDARRWLPRGFGGDYPNRRRRR